MNSGWKSDGCKRRKGILRWESARIMGQAGLGLGEVSVARCLDSGATRSLVPGKA